MVCGLLFSEVVWLVGLVGLGLVIDYTVGW